MKELSIIIVNYKSWNKLSMCLNSLLKQKEIRYEVIVVDNNSNDEKLLSFRQKYEWVKWIENSKNYGFAKACNIGAANTKSKWYLFLNPDTVIKSQSLNSLIEFCNTNPEHRIIGIKQLDNDKKHTNSFGMFLNFWSLSGLIRIIIRLKNGSYKSMNFKEIAHPDWISGSFILIRKTDFNILGGWDEDYWMYYEDMDLCKRGSKLGLKVSLLNNWVCTHFHGVSSRKNIKIKIITKSEVVFSSHIFLEKHSKTSYKLLNHLILVESYLITFLICSLILILYINPFSSSSNSIKPP